HNNLTAVGTNTNNSFVLFDTSNPTNPQLTYHVKDNTNGFNNLAFVHSVLLHETNLYTISYGDNAVSVIDVSDPYAPVLKHTLKDNDGVFSRLGGATDIAISGNLAAITSGSDKS